MKPYWLSVSVPTRWILFFVKKKNLIRFAVLKKRIASFFGWKKQLAWNIYGISYSCFSRGISLRSNEWQRKTSRVSLLAKFWLLSGAHSTRSLFRTMGLVCVITTIKPRILCCATSERASDVVHKVLPTHRAFSSRNYGDLNGWASIWLNVDSEAKLTFHSLLSPFNQIEKVFFSLRKVSFFWGALSRVIFGVNIRKKL